MPRVAAPLAWSGFGVHMCNLARSCPLSTKKVPGVACSLDSWDNIQLHDRGCFRLTR
jgi:hypothetical protein